jgi:hypothetical protein
MNAGQTCLARLPASIPRRSATSSSRRRAARCPSAIPDTNQPSYTVGDRRQVVQAAPATLEDARQKGAQVCQLVPAATLQRRAREDPAHLGPRRHRRHEIMQTRSSARSSQ